MASAGARRLGLTCMRRATSCSAQRVLAAGISSEARVLQSEADKAAKAAAASYTGGGGNAVTLSLLALGLAGGGYYYYVTQIEPQSATNLPPPPEEVKPLPAIVPDLVPPVPALPLEPIPVVSARDELVMTQHRLQKELEELRAQKRDPLIDLKKKEIKVELQIIKKGLSELDKKR